MTIKPIYVFQNDTETGVDSVPINGLFIVETMTDGIPKMYTLINKAGILATTTVADAIDPLKQKTVRLFINFSLEYNKGTNKMLVEIKEIV